MTRFVSILATFCLASFGFAAVSDAATVLPGFRSPSGNIRCFVVPGAGSSSYGRTPALLLCDLAHADYAARLQTRCLGPSGGGVDWHGFTLTANRQGSINCTGGVLYNPTTQKPSYVTLPYVKSWRRGAFICTSRVTGVTCRSRTGHGVFVSRQSWRVW